MAQASDPNAFRNAPGRAQSDLNPSTASGQPLVSIVTPSFNQARYLRSTLESVAMQRYPRLEHIVVDGGSTDGSVEILERFSATQPHVRWVSEPDEGQADAVNRGFRMATGEILGWLNSDDLYCVDAIPIAVRSLEQNPELDMVYGDAWLIDERGRIRRPWDFIENFDAPRLRSVKDYICQPATFLRRRVFEEVGPLDTSLHWAMDWDYWIRIAERGQGRVQRIPGYLACARDYADTKTSGGGVARLREAMMLMRRHNGGRVPPAMLIYFTRGVVLDAIRWKLRSLPITRELLRWNDERRARQFDESAVPPAHYSDQRP
jgi:glycosyltransferase involved in cell wall biosynthesis